MAGLALTEVTATRVAGTRRFCVYPAANLPYGDCHIWDTKDAIGEPLFLVLNARLHDEWRNLFHAEPVYYTERQNQSPPRTKNKEMEK